VVNSLLGGGFAVAWTDRSTLADGDNDGTAVKIRFFDGAASATTAQLLVNTSTAGDQGDAAMTRLQNGNIVVVWTDWGGNGGDADAGVKGQMFTAAGVKVGGEFIVNATLAGNQQNAAITTLGNGAFVVVWEDRNPGADDSDGCIRGQLFSADGVKLGGEFLVNIPAAGAQIDPDVAAVGDSKFIVQWGNNRQMFDAGDIAAPVIGTLSANTALEYASNGAVVGTVTASDAGVFTYSLVNNAGGRFAINSITGQITVADGLLLDFEQAASHLVRVRVEDASANASEQDFTINVGNRTPESVIGDSRANTFVGGAGTDNLTGGDGGDLLDGGLGADNLRGGLGNDRFYVDQSGDVVTEFAGQGSDTVFTTVSYTLGAGSEVETLRTGNAAGTNTINLTGNGFINTLLGNAGNNRLDGGVGADDLRGFGGNDLYFVDNAGDKITEALGGGTDTAVASASYALGAGVNVETLQTANPTGTTAINLTGNELNNVIRGNLGANVLRGNGGGDSLYAGSDSLRDSFVYGAHGDSAIGGHDMIFNFVKLGFVGDLNSDKIDLRPIDADDDLAGNQAFRFVSSFIAPVANQAEGQVMMQTVGTDTKVLIDLNGDNTADMQIIVKAVTGLAAGDFWL
jgi:hypothetical protein